MTNDKWQRMSFARPELLYILILVPFMGLFLLWAIRRREAALARLGEVGLIGRLSANINWRGRRWGYILWIFILTLLIIAMARPQWGSDVQVVEQQGIEIMVALDISQSMLAQDIKPDRLSRAKLEIADLMNRLNGDEIGLVLFSGASFIQFPLTADYATARTFLDNAQPGLISRPGTAIGQAIRTAMNGFDKERAAQKVIIVFTDGENHEPDTMEAVKEAATDNIIIYTIGFGSPDGEPIPQMNEQGEVIGYKKDQQGETILSRLDEVALQQIALTANGRYFRAEASGQELDALLAELSQLQRETLQNQFEIRQVERFQLCLAVALAAMVIMELIPERVNKKLEVRS